MSKPFNLYWWLNNNLYWGVLIIYEPTGIFRLQFSAATNAIVRQPRAPENVQQISVELLFHRHPINPSDNYIVQANHYGNGVLGVLL